MKPLPTLPQLAALTRHHLTTPDPTATTPDAIRACGRAALALLPHDATLCSQLAYQKLHDVPYRSVGLCWRRLYTDAGLWRAVSVVEGVLGRGEEGCLRVDGSAEEEEEEEEEEDWVDEVVTLLDMSIILCGAAGREELIEVWFAVLEGVVVVVVDNGTTAHSPPTKRRRKNPPLSFDTTPSLPTHPLLHPLPRTHAPSFPAFQAKLSNPATQTPVIITGAIDHWPALDARPWHDPAYLLRKTLGGRRLVPVEVGRSYTDEDWGQQIVRFGDFLRGCMVRWEDSGKQRNDYGSGSGSGTGSGIGTTSTKAEKTTYLAQHDLFAQIPALRADVCIPDYCYASYHSPSPSSPSPSSPSSPLLNAWLGPRNTISPLHTDPHHNILAQVVGHKYIRLYAPDQSARLYPRGVEAGGVDMGNTSCVDLEVMMDGHGEGEEEGQGEAPAFPEFRRARYVEGVVGPGECVYIPEGWWHYVRSLSGSCSVSFWF